MEHRPLRRRSPKSSASRATWGGVLAALVSTTAIAACSSSTKSTGTGTESYPDGHPCKSARPCDSYVKLPDGGVQPNTGTVPDGGTVLICGPCNG